MKVLSDIVYIMSAPKGRDLNHYWVEIQQTMRKCYIFTWKNSLKQLLVVSIRLTNENITNYGFRNVFVVWTFTASRAHKKIDLIAAD